MLFETNSKISVLHEMWQHCTVRYWSPDGVTKLSYLTSCESLAMRRAIRLAAAMISLSRLDHSLTSMCSAWAAI